MCTDLATARADLEHMKSLGANFVRLCHYPHHPGELDLCDELGLLAMAEIPLYWWNGLEEGEMACARKLEAAKRQLASMIRRDANHPAVIMWSVSNETQEQRPEVVSGNAELVALARELDPTRPATHVSDRWREHPHFGNDDIVCLNAYPSWAGRGGEGNPAYDLAESARSWREGLAGVHELYPEKPILVSEFGYPALESTFENGLGEDVQARVIETEFAAMDAPYVCGATVWCWADHPWPEESFVAYLTTSPFGVVTRERRPKAARDVVRRVFRERRGIAEGPSGAAESDADAPDTPVNMLRDHMRDIPEFPFPEGFSIRSMRPGEGALWTDLQRDAEEVVAIDDGMFEREFGGDLPATERRCFFVVDSKGAAVGTASGWYSRDFRGADWGRIHWVAVRRAYRRRGLARAAVSHALRYLARHHERAWLATSTSRPGAIRIYLDLGFVPDLAPQNATAAWRKVAAAIDHPALAGLR
jgi:GNAT superfamily N-acetyltransferase